AGDGAERHADEDREGRYRHADEHRDPGSRHDPPGEVTAEVVRAEQMPAGQRGPERVDEILVQVDVLERGDEDDDGARGADADEDEGDHAPEQGQLVSADEREGVPEAIRLRDHLERLGEGGRHRTWAPSRTRGSANCCPRSASRLNRITSTVSISASTCASV